MIVEINDYHKCWGCSPVIMLHTYMQKRLKKKNQNHKKNQKQKFKSETLQHLNGTIKTSFLEKKTQKMKGITHTPC